MGVLAEAFRAALASLMAHRMRSFLTTLGILIGTASVIAVVSLVQGLSASITDQFADMGGSTMSLQAVNDNDRCRQPPPRHRWCAPPTRATAVSWSTPTTRPIDAWR